jgi:hypothetical protein
MKQGRNTSKSKLKKEYDNFEEAKKGFNSRLSPKKSSKNWKNNIFDDDDYQDDDYLSEHDHYDEEE